MDDRAGRTPHPEDPAEGPDPDEHTDGAPLGGDEHTEEQLEADNPVEEDTLKALDPDDPPA